MINKILSALKTADVQEYLITELKQKSAELFFIKKTLDMKREKEVTKYEILVMCNFKKQDRDCKGSSKINLFPGMTDEEIVARIETAKLAASFVANKAYELPEPTENGFVEMASDLLEHSLEEDCRIMAEALFAEDNKEDVFINSAELFLYDDTVRYINSKGIDVGYRKCRVSGEFVAQCKEPQDVETYKDFDYKSLDTEALKARVRKTLEYTKARAEAKEAPKTGNYRLILSDDYVSTLFDFYLSKANAAYIYPGYSNYELNKDVQAGEDGREVTGDRLNVTLKASAPYSPEGLRMKDRVLLEDGVLKTVIGGVRFAYYLGIEPTGEYRDIAVKAGTTSVEEMKKQPYLEVVNFSDFQMDNFTGHFGGEIRLAFLHDGEKITPVTGGSVNGNWFEVQSRLKLSSDTQVCGNYEGPLCVCMEDIPVAGV